MRSEGNATAEQDGLPGGWRSIKDGDAALPLSMSESNWGRRSGSFPLLRGRQFGELQ